MSSADTVTVGALCKPDCGHKQGARQYVVSPDGQRFLINTLTKEATTSPITLILNWKPSGK